MIVVDGTQRDRFRRELGLFDSVVVVAGGIIGVGIFANPSNVARVVGDPGADPAGVGDRRRRRAHRRRSSGRSWRRGIRTSAASTSTCSAPIHPVVGFLYGIALLFIINGGSLAAVSILFASYVDRSFVPLGPIGIRAAAAAALIALTAVNAVGVRAGKWTNNLLMGAKVLGMLALVALAFGRGASPASHFDRVARRRSSTACRCTCC